MMICKVSSLKVNFNMVYEALENAIFADLCIFCITALATFGVQLRYAHLNILWCDEA